MANNTIQIQTVRWDLQANDLETAKDWQDKASAFSRDGLPLLLEKAFAAYPAEQTLVLDKIELDLLTVHDDASMQLALDEALQKFIQSHPYTLTERETATAAVPDFLTTLQSYLQSGILAWQADETIMNDDDKLLAAIKGYTPKQLIRTLSVLDENGLLRLLHLFHDDNQLEDLLLHLAEGTTLLASFFRWLRDTLSRQTTTTKWSASASRLLLYQVPLQYLLSGRTVELFALLRAWWLKLEEPGWLPSFDRGRFLEALAWEVRENVNTIPTDERQWSNALLSVSGYGKPSNSRTNDTLSIKHLPGIETANGEAQTDELSNQQEEKTEKPDSNKPEGSANTNECFIGNSGLILLYPYLKTVFGKQGWLDANGWLLPAHRITAARLLQFIALGHAGFKEYHLVLNKVICGCSPDIPIPHEAEPYQFSKDDADELLQTLISRWPKIGSTSPEGLRGSFLMRNGKLVEEETGWLLHVERKGWDLLLDALPYPIGLIKLPWMAKPLFVQW